MRKLTAILTAATLLGVTNLSMAGNDKEVGGSMDVEKPVTEIRGVEGDNADVKKLQNTTGDARGSTTGKKLIKSDVQKDEAHEGGLDGTK